MVIGHGYTSRLGVIRALGRAGYEVIVIVMTNYRRDGSLNTSKPIDCYSKYVSRVIYCPSDQNRLISTLHEECADPEQKVIIFTDSDFRILAGKTGTSPDNAYNVAFIARASDNSLFLCSLLGADSEEARWKHSLTILTCAYDKRRGINTKTLDVTAKSVLVSTYPEGEVVISKNSDSAIVPASLTKLIAALTASEYLTDWDVKVRVQRNDMMKGSGNNLRYGDYVTVRDLFYDMLLPSSNTAAHVLARLVGKKLC